MEKNPGIFSSKKKKVENFFSTEECLSDYHVTAKHHTAWGFRLKTETILAHQSRSA